MKVVFFEDVEGTAQVGDVKDVKNGFARNFLLPEPIRDIGPRPVTIKFTRNVTAEVTVDVVPDEASKPVVEKLMAERAAEAEAEAKAAAEAKYRAEAEAKAAGAAPLGAEAEAESEVEDETETAE